MATSPNTATRWTSTSRSPASASPPANHSGASTSCAKCNMRAIKTPRYHAFAAAHSGAIRDARRTHRPHSRLGPRSQPRADVDDRREPRSDRLALRCAPLPPGGNIRWGVTDNLTFNGTDRPDFSQIESDVPQFPSTHASRCRFRKSVRSSTTDSSSSTRRTLWSTHVHRRARRRGQAHRRARGHQRRPPVSRRCVERLPVGNGSPVLDILRARKLGFGTTIGLLGADRRRVAVQPRRRLDTRTVFGNIYDVRVQGVVS